MVQHAAEPFAAHGAAAVGCVVVHRLDELVAETLVIAFGVVTRDKFRHELAQMMFAQRGDFRQTLAPC